MFMLESQDASKEITITPCITETAIPDRVLATMGLLLSVLIGLLIVLIKCFTDDN